MRAIGVISALVLATVCGCARSEEAAAGAGSADDRVVVDDSRYRVAVRSEAAPNGEEGTFRVVVESRGSWHVALEAPAALRLEAEAPLEFDPPVLRDEHVVEHSEARLVFEGGYHSTGNGVLLGQGQLKFGVCMDQEQACEIIRRRFELPIVVR
jgi:hypothetical protein